MFGIEQQSFSVDSDPRFHAAQEQIRSLESEIRADMEWLESLPERMRQAAATLSDSSIRILRGDLTLADAERLRAYRDELEREQRELAAALKRKRDTLQGLREAQERYRRELQRSARARALSAYREIAVELKPVLLQASVLNDRLESIWHNAEINLPDIPRPWPELRARRRDYGDKLAGWLQDLERFDWNQANQ
jgi:hypothetical protein